MSATSAGSFAPDHALDHARAHLLAHLRIGRRVCIAQFRRPVASGLKDAGVDDTWTQRRNAENVVALSPQLRLDVVKRRLLHVGQDYAHTLPGEACREGTPHAAGSPRDNRDLAGEVLHGDCSPLYRVPQALRGT